jgi:hypothetical protein
MLEAKLKRMLPRFFAQIGENGDVAADQRLQSRADRSKNGARTNNDSAYHSEIFHNPVAVEFKRSRRHRWVHTANLDTVQAACTVFPSLAIRTRTVFRHKFRAGSSEQILHIEKSDVNHEANDEDGTCGLHDFEHTCVYRPPT